MAATTQQCSTSQTAPSRGELRTLTMYPAEPCTDEEQCRCKLRVHSVSSDGRHAWQPEQLISDDDHTGTLCRCTWHDRGGCSACRTCISLSKQVARCCCRSCGWLAMICCLHPCNDTRHSDEQCLNVKRAQHAHQPQSRSVLLSMHVSHLRVHAIVWSHRIFPGFRARSTHKRSHLCRQCSCKPPATCLFCLPAP